MNNAKRKERTIFDISSAHTYEVYRKSVNTCTKKTLSNNKTEYRVVIQGIHYRIEGKTIWADLQSIQGHTPSSTRPALGLNCRHGTCSPELDLDKYTKKLIHYCM